MANALAPQAHTSRKQARLGSGTEAHASASSDAPAHNEEARTRLGMWVFLSSESLLFAGLIALYAVYRVAYPQAFAGGVDHNNQLLGTFNTVILLTSSYTVASAVRAMQRGKARAALGWLASTLAAACAFMLIKGTEYAHHLREGMGLGTLATGYTDVRGERIFFTLYYGLTGIHALHVVIGMGLLCAVVLRLYSRFRQQPRCDVPAQSLAGFAELIALYWHFVDLVWILLWPLFYLTGSHP